MDENPWKTESQTRMEPGTLHQEPEDAWKVTRREVTGAERLPGRTPEDEGGGGRGDRMVPLHLAMMRALWI